MLMLEEIIKKQKQEICFIKKKKKRAEQEGTSLHVHQSKPRCGKILETRSDVLTYRSARLHWYLDTES